MDRRDHDDVEDDDELDSSDDDTASARSEEADDDAVDADDADDDDADDADDDDADDDADDDVDADADDTDPGPSAAPPAKRRSLGPTLLVLGGGVWAIAMALRLGAPEPGPALSVSPDAAPGLSAAREAEPAVDDADPDPDPDDDEVVVLDQEPDPEPAAADADQPDIVDDEPLPLEPPPEGWATDLDPPKKVTYTIRHGGSIKNVANLFKIFHHEITALNPGIALEQELPPNSKVVVYLADENQQSESVGLPSAGSLVGAVPMVEGPGRVMKMIPWKSWGTEHTVTLLDQVLRRWAERGKGVQPILVGNMAARKGGKLEPHSTHQSGRDVDIGYMQKLPPGEELNWREMNANNLDAAETWALLQLLRSTGQVEVIFIDTSIQKLLYEHAVKHGTVSKAELGRWLQYPTGSSRTLVQHVAGHVDHIHVRFACQPHEKRCESRGL